MKLQDALFNWLQMKIVAEARSEDHAAQDTCDFFETILKEDHQLEQLNITPMDEQYEVTYFEGTATQTKRFDRELADQLLHDIESNPKYNNQ